MRSAPSPRRWFWFRAIPVPADLTISTRRFRTYCKPMCTGWLRIEYIQVLSTVLILPDRKLSTNPFHLSATAGVPAPPDSTPKDGQKSIFFSHHNERQTWVYIRVQWYMLCVAYWSTPMQTLRRWDFAWMGLGTLKAPLTTTRTQLLTHHICWFVRARLEGTTCEM